MRERHRERERERMADELAPGSRLQRRQQMRAEA